MGTRLSILSVVLILICVGQACGQFSLLADGESGFSLSAVAAMASDADILGLGGVATYRGWFDLQFVADNTNVDVGRDFSAFVLSGQFLPFRFHPGGASAGFGPLLGYEYQNYGEVGGPAPLFGGMDITAKYFHLGAFAFLKMTWGSVVLSPRVELTHMAGRDDAPDIELLRVEFSVMRALSDKNALSLTPFVRLTDEDHRSTVMGMTLAFHGWNRASQ